MKIGIVGYGSIGQRHAYNAVVLGHEVIVYDPVARRDVNFERNIYEQADAVVIATPTMHHEAGLRACVERGKHVLVEKPISLDSRQIDALLDSAEHNSVHVMVGTNLRFHGAVQKAKQWVEEENIGKPIWAQFICAAQNDKYTADGVILNTGAHEVDLARYFFGPATVQCANTENDQIADFVLRHDNGVRSSFHLDCITPNRIREFWIAGTENNIGVDLDGRRANLGDKVSAYPGSYDTDYLDEMRAFIELCEHGTPNVGSTGGEGLATLETLLSVRRKAGLK